MGRETYATLLSDETLVVVTLLGATSLHVGSGTICRHCFGGIPFLGLGVLPLYNQTLGLGGCPARSVAARGFWCRPSRQDAICCGVTDRIVGAQANKKEVQQFVVEMLE